MSRLLTITRLFLSVPNYYQKQIRKFSFISNRDLKWLPLFYLFSIFITVLLSPAGWQEKTQILFFNSDKARVKFIELKKLTNRQYLIIIVRLAKYQVDSLSCTNVSLFICKGATNKRWCKISSQKNMVRYVVGKFLHYC